MLETTARRMRYAAMLAMTALAAVVFFFTATCPAYADWTENCYTDGDTSWYSDDESSFTINSADELAGLAKLVTIEGKTFEGKAVSLGSNIDLSSVCGPDKSWLPIGHSYTGYASFSGTFDGQGHTVSGLYINLDMSGVGLFGSVRGANVGNLTVKGSVTGISEVGGVIAWCSNSNLHDIESDVDVAATNDSSSAGNAGGVVAHSMTADDNSHCTYTSLINKGSVTGTNWGTGGVIGFMGTVNSSSIDVSQCANLGDVTVNFNGNSSDDPNRSAGGVIGSTTGDYGSFNVSECFNSGNVSADGLQAVGGIAGFLGGGNSSLAACYNSGNVSGDNSAGGIAGYFGSQGGSLQYTYNVGSVSGSSVGGTVGSGSNASQTLDSNFSSAELSGDAANAYGSDVQAGNEGTSLTIDQLRSKDLFDILNTAGSYFDWDDPSNTDDPANDGYPYLAWQNLKKGDPKEDDSGKDTDPDDGSGDDGHGSGGDPSGGDDDADSGSDMDGSGDSGDADDDGTGKSDDGDADDGKSDDSGADDDADDGGDDPDTDIDNSGGADPDDQDGKGSGIKDESLDNYTKDDGDKDKKSVKLDKGKLTHVDVVTDTAQKQKHVQKKAKKTKKTNKSTKAKAQGGAPSTQLVKVGVAASGSLEASSSRSALGGPVNWVLVCVLLCAAAGGGYEIVRFKRLQPSKQKTNPQIDE